jgi:hypothetical protein
VGYDKNPGRESLMKPDGMQDRSICGSFWLFLFSTEPHGGFE